MTENFSPMEGNPLKKDNNWMEEGRKLMDTFLKQSTLKSTE